MTALERKTNFVPPFSGRRPRMSDTRPEVEKLITYIEDELCKRMDIDDFDVFFTELATELFRRYGPSVQQPTRPEAVQEAMEFFLATEPFGPSELRLYEAGKDLAAYVRELEAERGRLKERSAELEDLFDFQHTRTVEAVELWRQAHPGNALVMPDLGELLAWLMAELAEARKGRG